MDGSGLFAACARPPLNLNAEWLLLRLPTVSCACDCNLREGSNSAAPGHCPLRLAADLNDARALCRS